MMNSGRVFQTTTVARVAGTALFFPMPNLVTISILGWSGPVARPVKICHLRSVWGRRGGDASDCSPCLTPARVTKLTMVARLIV